MAGVFSNDREVVSALEEAGKSTNERVWPMPISKAHTEELKSTIADTRSTGKTRLVAPFILSARCKSFVLTTA